MIRTFKKYPNRRLYDNRSSGYVNLDFVKSCILSGEQIEVMDSRTQQDITHLVLLQIISEQEGQEGQRLMTNQILTQLVRFYESPMTQPVKQMLEYMFGYLDQQHRQYAQWMQNSASVSNPFSQGMDMWSRWMQDMSAFTPQSRDKD